jgi:hypothetical protein
MCVCLGRCRNPSATELRSSAVLGGHTVSLNVCRGWPPPCPPPPPSRCLGTTFPQQAWPFSWACIHWRGSRGWPPTCCSPMRRTRGTVGQHVHVVWRAATVVLVLPLRVQVGGGERALGNPLNAHMLPHTYTCACPVAWRRYVFPWSPHQTAVRFHGTLKASVPRAGHLHRDTCCDVIPTPLPFLVPQTFTTQRTWAPLGRQWCDTVSPQLCALPAGLLLC